MSNVIGEADIIIGADATGFANELRSTAQAAADQASATVQSLSLIHI